MWDFFIRKNRFAYLFLLVLVALGSYSIVSIPRESSPEVVIPVGIVTTVLPGAPAADIEVLVTNEIERGLNSLQNVANITSTSREGVSSITVEFEASADVDASIQDLKDQIDSIQSDLPADAEDPFVSEVDFQDQPIMTIAVAGDVSDRGLSQLADSLEAELESLAGVSRVELSGVREQEIAIIVEPAALVRYDISLTQVTNAIRNANVTLPIGQIKNDGVIYNIAFEGDIEDTTQIANIAVTTRGGQPVYVRDIATVVDGLTPATSLSRLSQAGAPSVNALSANVFKQSGGDVTAIANAVNERVDELKSPGGLLDGFTSETVLDSGAQIESDLIQLSTSGLQTVVLVVLLLVVAIGWREGLLAGAAIPLSFLFGFIGLYFSGNSINFLSLFSLILGIGILVDSAIVMVEGINRRMKDNPDIDKRQAAIETIKEFSTPLIAGTLTTVSMFAGLFIVTGVIGQFIRSIPFTIIFLLLASLFVALAIIPLLAASFLKRRSTTKLERAQTEYSHRLEKWYRKQLDILLGDKRRERIFLWGIRIALVIALLLPAFGVVKVIFFAQGDVDFLIVEVEKAEGTSKEVTDIAVRRVEELLYEQEVIDSFVVTVGSGSAFGGGGTGEKLANIFLNLDPERVQSSTEVTALLRAEFAQLRDLKITVNQPSNGPPTGAAVVLKFLGDDLQQLTSLTNQAADIVRGIENTTNVETSTNNNNTEFVLELDRAQTAALGLDPFTVSQIARTAVFGTDATSLTTITDDIDVVVKLNVSNDSTVNPDTTNVASINDLIRIEVPIPAGGSVPLSTLVAVSLRESSTIINHEGGERVVSLTADISEAGNAREIQAEAIRLINAELDLNGATLSSGGGETQESNAAFIEVGLALLVGIALMIGVLTLQFNSFLHTRYVLTILPYSLIGIFAGLAITGSPLSFPSMMGFIALSGIVVNNSILLIDVMNRKRLASPSKPIKEVVLDAASSRLRPILLTTLTTVIGMVPLTLAGDLWAPLAYAVMFGLVFSVVITLVLIPIIYNRKPGTVGR